MRLLTMGNRWKTVLIVTLVNLLMEYSVRGINNLREIPLLPLALFLNYFPYFAMIEDLIGKYRLKDYQVFVAALCFGLLWQLLGPSAVFFPPLVLGVNWGILLFVNLVWWAPIQTVLAFYIANRVLPRQEWDSPLLSKAGWVLSLILFVSVTLAFRVSVPGFPLVRPPQIIIMGGLILAAAAAFRRILPSPRQLSSPPPLFEKDRVLDGISAGMILFLLYCALFLTSQPSVVYVSHVNITALRAVLKASLLVAGAMLAHRLRSRRPIPV